MEKILHKTINNLETQPNQLAGINSNVSDQSIIKLIPDSEISSRIIEYVSSTFSIKQHTVNYIEFEYEEDRFVFVKKSNIFYRKNNGDSLSDNEVRNILGNDYDILLNNISIPVTCGVTEDRILDDIFKFNNEIESYSDLTDEEKLRVVFTDYSSNHIIIGSPGIGKTSSALRFLTENKTPFVFVVPTKALMKQILTKYAAYNLNEVRTDSTPFEIRELFDMRESIVTYYNGFDLISKIIIQKWDYVLVLDEIHTLVLHSEFRSKVIKSLYKDAYKFKKIVGLTATPYGCISRKNDFRFVRIGSEELPGNIQYNIIPHLIDKKNKKDYLSFIINAINNFIRLNPGKYIVFINDKKIINNVRHGLVLNGIFKNEEIVSIATEVTDLESVSEILKSEKIGETIKIIITTSVFTNGVNLYDNDYAGILIFDVPSLIDIYQLIFRPRNKSCKLTINDFISALSDTDDFAYDLLLSSIKTNVEQIQNSVNTLRKIVNIKSKSAKFAFEYGNKIISLLRSKTPFEINIEQIYNYAISSLFNYLSIHPEFRKKMLQKMGINACVKDEYINDNAQIDLKQIISSQNIERSENFNSFISQIKSKKSQLLRYCTKQNLIDAKQQNLIPSGQPPLLPEYYLANKNLLNDPSLKTWLRDYLLYRIENKISHYESTLLIDANNRSIGGFKFYIRFIQNISNRSKRADKDAEFCKRIDRYFLNKNGKTIRISELMEEISKYNSDSELIDFFSTKPQKKFSNIYKITQSERVRKKKTEYHISYLSFEKKGNHLLEQFGVYSEFNERALSKFKQFLKS